MGTLSLLLLDCQRERERDQLQWLPCRCPKSKKGSLTSCNNENTEYPRQWVWAGGDTAASCIPRRLEYTTVSRLFRGKRIALVGDSHLRKLYGYLGSFLEGTPGIKHRHSHQKEIFFNHPQTKRHHMCR
jgi:hypothetical protein